MDEAVLSHAMDWICEQFRGTAYREYRDPEGRPKYLEIKTDQQNGVSIHQTMPVRALAMVLLESVPDFDSQAPAAVKALLREAAAKRRYGIDPLFEIKG